mgnify:CR=1 FL=1
MGQPKCSSRFPAVNQPNDQEEMSDLEKRHLPTITAPARVRAGKRFEVSVEVGSLLPHPNEKEHFIRFIDLYAGDVYLTRAEFTAETTSPVLRAWPSLPGGAGPLVAYCRCNQHGTWKSSVPITVD